MSVSEEFSRTASLLGENALERLKSAHVAVFGLGGVGGYAAEALVRSGVGFMDLIDGDKVSASNINRQIIALKSTVGKLKTEACGERFYDISPYIELRKFPLFLNENSVGAFNFAEYDYVVDAIDDIPAKVLLAEKCAQAGVKIISSMGAGNKLNPMGFCVSDIFATKVCPLARVMRHELRARGIERLKVVFSTEQPVINDRIPASCAFVPSAAGLLIASEVVKDLISEIPEDNSGNAQSNAE